MAAPSIKIGLVLSFFPKLFNYIQCPNPGKKGLTDVQTMWSKKDDLVHLMVCA
jgi:hypothetical protein